MKSLLLIVLALLLSGCNVWTSEKDIEAAELKCAQNGGVYSILVEASPFWEGTSVNVYCKNGAIFEIPGTLLQTQEPKPSEEGQ